MELKFKLGDIVDSEHGMAMIVGVDFSGDIALPYIIAPTNQSIGYDFKLEKSRHDYDVSILDSAIGMGCGWVGDDEIWEFERKEDIKKEVYVRRFKSGAIRSDDRGRENPAFISPYALKFLAEHFSANAAFFNGHNSAKNYMKGIEPIDIEGSLARHYLEFQFAMMPNRVHDVKDIKKSLVEIMANCVMGLHQIGLAEDGEYVELFTQTEYIKKDDK